MKKFFSILVATIFAVSSFSPISAKANETVIIYTNDTHCEIDGALGFADISAIKAIEEEKGNKVIILDAGDAVQGGPIGAISKGEYVIDIMNEVGYDFAVLGNHEFDYMVERLMELSKMADFPYISANFVSKDTKETVFSPYYMINADGLDIAFIAITTPHTFTSTTPKYFQNDAGEYIYDFCGENLYSVMQKNIDEVTKNGADVIIGVTHLGVDEADTPFTSKELIKNTSGLDAVIDAHSHVEILQDTEQDKDGKGVFLTSTGTKFSKIGVMRVSADGEISMDLVDEEYKAGGISVEAQNAYDKSKNFIEDIRAEYDEELKKVIAKTEYDLTIYNPEKYSEESGAYREVRRGETNMGNFCADAYRYVCDSDIAIINGGGVRAEVKKGDISYGDLLNVNPFGNELSVVEVTGRQILDALEHGARSYPAEEGAFLQVSGLTYEIDEAVASPVVLDDKGIFKEVSGKRRVKNVRVSGVAIDEEKKYTLAGSNYTLLDLGDGFSMFSDSKIIKNTVCSDVDALVRYITEGLGGNVAKDYENPLGEGRIKKVSDSVGFYDINNHWAKDSIELAVRNGLVKGISEELFGPDKNITRAMFVTLLYRAEGEPFASKPSFTDVLGNEYFADAVAWANEEGIVNGISETEFAPDKNISREQIAAILYRYAQYKKTDVSVGEDTNILSYSDFFEISEYAISAIQWSCGAGIINGRSNGVLSPKGAATRAETTVILIRFLEKYVINKIIL